MLKVSEVRPDSPTPAQPSSRWATGMLVTGGVLSAVMGAAHFVLPVIYPWEQHVEDLYEPLRWVLFSTTWFFGLLLVLGGALTVMVAREPHLRSRFAVWVVSGMAAFWVLAGVYELIVPFPAPEAQWALPIFSGFVAAVHLAGLWLRRVRAPGRHAGGAHWER